MPDDFEADDAAANGPWRSRHHRSNRIFSLLHASEISNVMGANKEVEVALKALQVVGPPALHALEAVPVDAVVR